MRAFCLALLILLAFALFEVEGRWPRHRSRGPRGRSVRRPAFRGQMSKSPPWSEKSLGEQCQDIEIYSDNNEYYSERVEGCRWIKSVTLNWSQREWDCELGQTFGFDRSRIFVDYGCGGSFRVCCRPVTRNKQMRKSLRCRRPFYEEDGRCIVTEKNDCMEYVEAAQKCADIGGKLLQVDDLVTKAGQLKRENRLKRGRYFIGGAKAFSQMNFEMSFSAQSVFTTSGPGASISHQLDMNFAFNIAEMFKMAGINMRAFRRFGTFPSVDILNMDSPLNSQCLAYDVGDEVQPSMTDCDQKANYICEQMPIDKEDEGCKWSPWINMDTDADGDENESLCDIIEAVGKGNLEGIKPGDLCEKPLAMECRNVKTKRLFSPGMTQGLDLTRACVKDSFRCRDFDQTCPDVEVRFKCPNTPLKDCAVDRVRKFCEKQGKRCEMTPVGAKCVMVPARRSGKEIIGKATCKAYSKLYNVSTCVTRGDPHYHTLDGMKFDFQGGCSYVMATTCNNYMYNPEFPPFTITSVNEPLPEDTNFSTTKGFILSFNGVKYTFTRGKFYVNRGGVNLERNFVDYSDNQITIRAKARDRGDFGLTIDTNFCMRIKWDNKYMLQLRIPEPYMKHICGLCGNYDGIRENDLTLPGSSDIVTPNKFGEYHISSGLGTETCVDMIEEPQKCPKAKFDKYTSNKFCGVLNPDGESPFAKAVVEATKTECNIRRLREIYEECVVDHCWAEIPNDDRCHMLEANIEETLLELNVRDESLDKLWREYADCGAKCYEKPNMEYKSSYMPNCQNTCLLPTKSTVCCDKEVVPGCVCKKGFFLDSKMNCVPLEECDLSCNIVTDCGENVNVKNNETVVIVPCEKAIKCVNGKATDLELDGCSEHAECLQDGQTCKCLEGYRGDGKTCRPARPCRKNYVAMGTKCYRLVRDPLDWHRAAINCGADGASLVRYDNVRDIQVEKYFGMIPELLLLETSTAREMECCPGATCNIASNKAALTVKVANDTATESCKGKFRISKDRRQLIVDEGCDTKFLAQTIDPKKLTESRQIVVWAGGNTEVLKYNQRAGKTPFQVEPPCLLDPSSCGETAGCFQATRNAQDQFILSSRSDCDAKLPSICEYDNTVLNNYDPLDLVAIKVKVSFKMALAKCKEMNRPLASLKNAEQQQKALSLIKGLKHSAFISATYDVSIKAYRWEDGERLAYTNWVIAPEPYRSGHDHFCVTMNPHDGKWYSRKCSNGFFAICGPPNSDVPLVFTPYYPIPRDISIDEIKAKIRRAQSQDYICDEPVMMECSAQAENGDWVTQETQTGSTIKCTKDQITCAAGKGLDCTTFKVRFLCPLEENQCKELATLNATACTGGKKCFPVQNHYICKCPPGMTFSERTKECNKVCGECSAWGDPHYTTYRGNKYDFMGACKYKFTGLCDPQDNPNAPFFEVFTTNVACTRHRSDGTCIDVVEVKLTNIPITTECGATIPQDFVLKAKVRDKRYWIDDVEYTDEINDRKDVWKITFRPNEWIVTIHSLDLTVKLIGNHLRVQVPERFTGNLCGLCGDCNSEKFRLRNGTAIEVPKKGYRWNWNTMKILGDDWRVANKDSSFEKCSKNITEEECSTTEKLKLQDEKYCGVFLKQGNFLQSCFEKMNQNGTGLTMAIKRQEYHHNCIFDMCGADNPDEAICDVLKNFAQECAYVGETVQWRSPERCPMQCPPNEIYRIDASCQRRCNEEPGTQGVCDEEPVEGCACKDGFRRRNNKCVPKEECGCRVMDHEGNLIKYLQPDETVILPKCTELAKCIKTNDGTLALRFVDYSLPNNAICANTVPPKYICAKGFKFAEDGVTCVKARDSCSSTYGMMDGICLSTPLQKRNWRQFIYRCNQADGTLVHVDTVQKIATMKKLLVDKKWTSLYVSGRVVAKNMFGLVMFSPLLEEAKRGKIEWMNFNFYEGFVEKLFLSKDVDKSTIPKEGLVMSVVATLDDGEVIFKAVSSSFRSNVVCEERPPPDKPEWTPPCNTDSNMEDDGDQETLFNMQIDDDCMVCPRPIDVKCENAKGSTGVEGKCQVTPDGVFYSCNQGKACADKTVSTKCHKDVDECAEKRDDCPKDSKCINTIGAFRCKCSSDAPLMVKGTCSEVTSCVVKGPEMIDEFIYSLKPFSGNASAFDIDCIYKIVSYCGDAAPKDVPFISVYDTSERSETKLHESVYVVIENPETKAFKVAIITPEDLANGAIKYDNSHDNAMEVRDVGFIDDVTGVKFELSQGPKLTIRSTDNLYKVSITFPLKVQVDLSSSYTDKVCGVCTAVPPEGEQNLVFSEDKLKELTVNPGQAKMLFNPKECKPRTPPRDLKVNIATTPPPTTKAPTTTPPPTKPATKAPAPAPVPPPPPPPPATGQCEQDYKDFCRELSSVCAVSRRACEMTLCPGKTSTCDYLTKNAIVSCNTGDKLKSFIKKQDCDSVCASNSNFQYARQSLVRTCSHPYGICAEEDTVNDDYGFMCICSAGFVLSGKTCVRPEACGCTMEDGSYKPPGLTWRSKDCSEIITCEGGGKTTRIPSPCGENTACSGKGGKNMQCKCLPGFFGNPSSKAGCKPGVDFPGKVCFDYDDEITGKTRNECVCKEGYVSDCKDCLDVDECCEGIHNCDLSSEKCVNIPGSFKCDCMDGFIRDGYKCKADDTNKCPNAQERCKTTWNKDKEKHLCSASVAYRQCLDKILLENTCPKGPDYPQELNDADKTCINKEPEPNANSGLPNEPVFTSWTPFGDCVYHTGDCGLGFQKRTRQVVPYSDNRKVRTIESYEVKESRVCFKKCPGMKPQDCPCSCVCDESSPVCGAIGPGKAKTFKSECQLVLESCTSFYTAVKLYDGPCSKADDASNRQMCSAGPRHKIMKYDKVKNGRRCVGEPVQIGTCQNMLCEGSSCNCCQPLEFERIQVNVKCFSTDKKEDAVEDKHIYISATKCGCTSLAPLQ
ncbi:hypothetical protein RRG08_035225 [Elysia crispata]|uniref:Uncharacterized protein n=1 Tax=Elysia crispata TaxID=231223 RepID=A0AAE1DIP9_9GAST|nr:hypothetical protein RRG08_035225 [Elysia crispata]